MSSKTATKKKTTKKDAPAEEAPAAEAPPAEEKKKASPPPEPKKSSSKSKSKSKSGRKRGGGEPVNFDQRTMQEFKEAFGLMDANKDGVIDKNDLKSIFAELGQIPPDSQIEEMLAEADGPLTFAVFLELFGERLTGTDPEETIVGAFKMFDPKDTGTISENELLRILAFKKGEPFDDDEIAAMHKGKPPIEDGQVNYVQFAHLICTGAAEELAKE